MEGQLCSQNLICRLVNLVGMEAVRVHIDGRGKRATHDGEVTSSSALTEKRKVNVSFS